MSFCWMLLFHQGYSATGAHWLDDLPDLTCKQTKRQHPLDGPLLS